MSAAPTPAAPARDAALQPAPVPPAYRGVWARTLLEGPDIATDTSSTVLWLQTARWHADLRQPAGRPASLAAHRSLAACGADEAAWLARQQGFSGITAVVEDSCEWLREVDFQPPRRGRDIGRMVFAEDGARVEEYGIESDYHETWVRLPESLGPTAAWQARDGRRLLVAGRCFFLVRPRAVALPRAENLATLVAAEPALAPARLGMELSFGRIGADGAWTIAHSTLPWCEGRALELGDRREWVCLLCEDGALAPG